MSDKMNESDIIFDWNELDRPGPLFRHKFTFLDETLRDGIQSPSVTDPSTKDKAELIRILDAMGIQHVNVGLPGAGPRAVEDVLTLAGMIRDEKLAIKPAAAARTHPNDIRPIIDAVQKLGAPIEVMAFIGSSPIRAYAEEWDLDRILRLSADAIDLATREGLAVTYVTEDTTRSRPETLTRLFRNAIEHGARRLCLCDTVGHATPDGIRKLIHFTRDFILGTGESIGVDWHGHNDRGLGVTNAIYALEFGADRCHGTVLGVGERVGNAALDQILVNLKLLGHLPSHDLSRLIECCQLVSRACDVPIPYNYPVAGSDAFRTATGVHAAAIIKAEKKGHGYLADRIYSGVPAGMFGREQEIEIGHMSGESNVVYWLKKRGITPDADLVKKIYMRAKAGNRLLTEGELRAIVEEHRQATEAAPAHVTLTSMPTTGST